MRQHACQAAHHKHHFHRVPAVRPQHPKAPSLLLCLCTLCAAHTAHTAAASVLSKLVRTYVHAVLYDRVQKGVSGMPSLLSRRGCRLSLSYIVKAPPAQCSMSDHHLAAA